MKYVMADLMAAAFDDLIDTDDVDMDRRSQSFGKRRNRWRRKRDPVRALTRFIDKIIYSLS